MVATFARVPLSAALISVCLLQLFLHTCYGAGSCKSDDKVDPRNPRNTIQRCIITKDKDFNLIPSNATALWVEFPMENTVNFATHFPTLSKLQYLKMDVTYLTMEPKAFQDNFQLPKLKSLSIIRDLNEVDSQNIAITIEDDLFLGLFHLENLYLDNLGIQDFSENTLRGLDSLETLDLTLNYISEIKPFMFSHCKNLTTLKLTDNFISSIEESSFAGLSLLGNLDISLNKLKILPAGPLLNLKELEIFVATSNDLHTIESGAFAGLGKLHYLSLARNNLSEIDPLAFQGLTALETFILDHNKIQLQMGQFAQASNILHLYMAHNDIKGITSDHFEGLLSITELILEANSIDLLESQVFYPMPTLMTLDIRDNKIKHVEENAFQGLTTLETLNIQENRIQTLPPGSFDDLTNLKTLYMDQNPWVCNCETEWLINWLRDRQNQIQPEAQFFFIICSENDPIPTETFHALILSKHFFEELNCGEVFIPSKPNGKTTDKNKNGQQTNGDEFSTTEKNVIKVHNKGMSKTQKVIIIVCSVLAVLALVAIIAIHIYCRQKKHRSWVPPDQKKLDQQKSVLPQSKKVSTSYSDPEAGYWSRICDDLPQLYPNENNNTTNQSEILKAAGKSTTSQQNYYNNGTLLDSQAEHQQHQQYVYQNHSYIADSLDYIHRATNINHQKRADLSDTEQKHGQQQSRKKKSKKVKVKKKVKLGPQTVVQIERRPNQGGGDPRTKSQQEQDRRQLNTGASSHSHSNQNHLPPPQEHVRKQQRNSGNSHNNSELGRNNRSNLEQMRKLFFSEPAENHDSAKPSHKLFNNHSRLQPTRDESLEQQLELQSLRH